MQRLIKLNVFFKKLTRGHVGEETSVVVLIYVSAGIFCCLWCCPGLNVWDYWNNCSLVFILQNMCFDRFCLRHIWRQLVSSRRRPVQKNFCRFITQLLLGTGPIYSRICSPWNILIELNYGRLFFRAKLL